MLIEATKLYESFTGHKGDTVFEYQDKKGGIGQQFGYLDYIQLSSGKIIEFKGPNRPKLGSSFDGKQLYVLSDHAITGIDKGKIKGIAYTTRRDGQVERYLHDFLPASAPFLNNVAGKLLIKGGSYQFLNTGINDR